MKHRNASSRIIGSFLVVLAATLAQSCETEMTGFGQVIDSPLVDPSSGAPRFAGIWDLYALNGERAHLCRLICDATGDPRELQRFGLSRDNTLLDSFAACSSRDCTVIHGSPSPAYCFPLDGQLSTAPAGAGGCVAIGQTHQEGRELQATFEIAVYLENGPTGWVTLELKASFVGDENDLEEAMRFVRVTDLHDSPSGLVIDAAFGTLEFSGILATVAYSESIRIVAIRSLFY